MVSSKTVYIFDQGFNEVKKDLQEMDWRLGIEDIKDASTLVRWYEINFGKSTVLREEYWQ